MMATLSPLPTPTDASEPVALSARWSAWANVSDRPAIVTKRSSGVASARRSMIAGSVVCSPSAPTYDGDGATGVGMA